MFTIKDFSKASQCFGQWYVFTRRTSKYFSYEERLTQETLNLTSARYSEFIFVRQFFHTEDCDNILKIAIFLQYFLYSTSYCVVLFTKYMWVQNTACRVQRIHRWIDTKFRNGTRQYCCRIQVSECRRWRRVS